MSVNYWVERYFRRGFTYEEILNFLSKHHDRHISMRSLQRTLKDLGFKRKKIKEDDSKVICAAILDELEASGSDLGYKSLWSRLQQIHGLNVKRSTVLKILHLADPDGIAERSQYRLKRRKYKVPGPNFLWHVDGSYKHSN